MDVANVTPGAIARVAIASGPELVQLSVANSNDGAQWTFAQLHAVCSACPRMTECEVDARVDCAAYAAALLSNAAPFGALRVRALHVSPAAEHEPWTATTLGSLTASAGLARVASLHFFAVRVLHELEVITSVCTAAAATRIPRLSFVLCRLGADAWAPLASLLEGGALTSLTITGDTVLLATPQQTLPFCTALHRCGTLTQLLLDTTMPLDGDAPGAGAADIIHAAAGHATLRELRVSGCQSLSRAGDALGAALRALVATPGGALDNLDVSHCRLGDRELGPMLDALASGAACPLENLNISGSALSTALEEGALLAAAASAARLRRLRVGDQTTTGSATARRASQIVAARVADARRAGASKKRDTLITSFPAWSD